MSLTDVLSAPGVFSRTTRVVTGTASQTIDKGVNIVLPLLIPVEINPYTTTTICSTSLRLIMNPDIDSRYAVGGFFSFLFFNLDIQYETYRDTLRLAGCKILPIDVSADGIPETDDSVIQDAFSQPIGLEISVMSIAAVSSVLFPMIGKQPTEQGFGLWWASRCRAAEGKFNIPATSMVILQPSKKHANAIYSQTMGHASLRKSLFMTLADYRKTHSDKMADAIDMTMILLKNTGLTHMVLIDKYLVTPYHPALFCEKAKPDLNALIQAYLFLKGVPDEQKNYLRFLRSEDELSVLNRMKFRNLTAIAYHLAIKKEPSLSNYNPALNESLKPEEKTLIDRLDQTFGKSVDVTHADIYRQRYGNNAFEEVQRVLNEYTPAAGARL
nr:MAG: hypothetical protein 1 [Wuchang romanomermis nematode virus 2]